jgi:glycosyltransferase involved in cell wall biosynthesis
LRVLHIVDGVGTYGGAEQVARGIAQGLDTQRYRSTFCVTRWEPLPAYAPALVELRESGVDFVGLERRSRFELGPWRDLLAKIRAERFDIVHSHKLGSNLWAALLCRRAEVPLFIAQDHTWSFEGQPYRRFIDRNLIARRADAFVAVSALDKQRMAEIEHIPEAKLRLVVPGIPPLAEATATREQVRGELGIDAEAPVVGAVATLRKQKALQILIRAVAELVREFPALRVIVVGGEEAQGGDLRSELSALIAELGLERVVQLLGNRSDVVNLLGAIDVAALSSDFEGTPLSIMEYMAAGLPVVTTDVGGVPDVVVDGETGILVPRRDPVALASGIASVLRDPEMAKRMGEAGRARQRREFTMAASVKRVEELYEDLRARAA